MRRAWILAAVLAAAVSGACSLKNVQEPEKAGGAPAQEEGASTGREDGRKTALPEAGAAPYDFSEAERYVLESFGMYGRSNLFAFRGPQGAASLEVNVYRLNPDGAWEVIGGGGASLGSGGYVISGDGSLEEAEGGEMDGVLALEIQEDHSIALHINSLGRVSCETEPIALETEIVGSAVRFLDEFVPMELGQELPVALMLYDSGSRMELPGLEDYFAPEKFSGIDLVQAVTLRFSEEAGDGGRFDEAGNGGVSSEAGDGGHSGKAEAIDISGEASGEADSQPLAVEKSLEPADSQAALEGMALYDALSFFREDEEWELRFFAQEEMVADGELALDDRCHFLVQAVRLSGSGGAGAWTLFDDTVQLGTPAGDVWVDMENQLHIALRDVRTARYRVAEYVYEPETERFLGRVAIDGEGINYWGSAGG